MNKNQTTEYINNTTAQISSDWKHATGEINIKLVNDYLLTDGGADPCVPGMKLSLMRIISVNRWKIKIKIKTNKSMYIIEAQKKAKEISLSNQK